MNLSIINKYKISFQNQIIEWDTKDKEISKTIITNNSYLSTFLIDWDSISEINELLIPGIDEALGNPNAEIDNGSATINIIIKNDVVIFYDNHSPSSVYRLPTIDFKEVVLSWREFLAIPPLNGTKI